MRKGKVLSRIFICFGLAGSAVFLWGLIRHYVNAGWSMAGFHEFVVWVAHGHSGAVSWAFYFLCWVSLVVALRGLASFLKDREGPDRLAAVVLLAGVVGGLGLGYVLYYEPSSWRQFVALPWVQRMLWPLTIQVLVAIFPVLWGLFGFMSLAHICGWGLRDPIEAELRKQVWWPKKVNHATYRLEAKRKGTTYLGYEAGTRAPVYLSADERNKHTQILGSTGSGKTRFTLFPMMAQDIAQGRGVIFIDAKGSSENAKTVFKMVEEAGREKDFLYFSLTDLEHSNRYNPLMHGNSSQLKDKIAGSIEWSEPFYQRTCENALQALFMDLDKAGRRVTLGELYSILKDPPVGLPSFRDIAARNKKNIETLYSEIGLLVNTPFGPYFESQQDGIDLLDAYKSSKVVYFALDTQSYQQTAMRVGKMITQDINTLSGVIESQFAEREKRPLAVYIDEYQAFGTRGFINALARGRSSGLWITIAHQSLGDLKAVDDAYCQQVIENTNTKVFLRVNDPETAQLFSDTVGTGKAVATTGQVHLEGEDPKNIMGSIRVVQEYLIHPTEVKKLDAGQGVFKSGRRFGRLSLDGFFKDVTDVLLPAPEAPSLTLTKIEAPIPEGPIEEQVL